VLFVARAGVQKQTLYRYANGGPSSIVARERDAAPGGSAFGRFAAGSFGRLSLNASGNAAFFARLALPGSGVFVQMGGTLEKAAQTTDPSPAGGFFTSFPSVSAIDDANEVAFVGLVDTGHNGIFRYDAIADILTAVVTTTDSDTSARPFCAFGEVGLSNAGLAFTATVGVPDCLTPVQGVFRDVAGTFVPVALVGDASPIGGTTYASFSGAPEIGSRITFAANVVGVTFTGGGIFDGLAASKIVAQGDAAPDVGGTVRKVGGQHRQTLAGDVELRLFLRQTTVGNGIFRYDATPEAAVAKTDAAPSPPYGALATYRDVIAPAIDENGAYLAFKAKVKDTVSPRSKTGVLRCTP
jgi:hypothetical protein